MGLLFNTGRYELKIYVLDKFIKMNEKYFIIGNKMFYIFSAVVRGKTYWYKNLSDLPIDGSVIDYFIYPVYEIGDKNYNLQRQRISLKNYGFYSDYNYLYEYLKDKNIHNINSVFIQGIQNLVSVFYNEEAYIDYNVQTGYCQKIFLE